jgi:hypothetical protein
MEITIKKMIHQDTELAEVLYNCNKYNLELDIKDYAYIIASYEYNNIPKTIFKTIVERGKN